MEDERAHHPLAGTISQMAVCKFMIIIVVVVKSIFKGNIFWFPLLDSCIHYWNSTSRMHTVVVLHIKLLPAMPAVLAAEFPINLSA